MKIENGPSNPSSDSSSFSAREQQSKPLLKQEDPTAQTQTEPDSPLQEDHEAWRIILYYCYIDIEQTNNHVEFHQHLCQELQLQGRIRVSKEGINGILSCRLAECQQYEDRLRAELGRLVPFIENDWELDVKYCPLRTDLPVPVQLFDSLMVKETSCLVSLFEPGLLAVGPNNNDNSQKKKHSKQTNRRRRRQQQRKELQQEKLNLDNHNQLQEAATQTTSFQGAQHLSPAQWNQMLGQANDAVLLDCRNVYESNVGYFEAPSAKNPTLLTNTRKYSDLPKVLAQSKDQWVHKKQIFMYCTGGVRCEQASKFVQALVATEQGEEEQKGVQVYQLHGGIQRYLEHFHNNKPEGSREETSREATTSGGPTTQQEESNNNPCLYRGLNFVFDPRRTDPMVNSDTSSVGKCCLCGTAHDDYDNGHAPSENQEARCCKCRILLLVCPSCRLKVQSWGEDPMEGLPQLFCGIDACSDYQATGANPVAVALRTDVGN